MHHFQVVTPIILLFHESQPEKRVNHSIKPTAGGASSMVNPLTGHTLRLEFLRTKSGTVGLQNIRKKSFSLENMRNSPPSY